ncbi:asparagine synthase [Nostoc edaphicum CCNP1411]|uniref:Asparagine synthase n=1 Tax=Nostoc edaphicum CCNP1411 TaxID=1472755 RepID=A0A7D7LG11_9NOSO|nr:TylF/MycF/NovP-related O-methyltransferase [Nostoc edaphicum]QMS90670.1 asparagine synthase [Nostoc edaphicum CCNP1411]
METHLSKSEQIQLFKKEFSQEHELINRIREKNLTYCGYPKLENICRAIKYIQKKQVHGLYLEAGCALGGSAILIAHMKPNSVPLHIFDVFGMIPPPSEWDGIDAHNRYAEISSGKSQGLGGNEYYGYIHNLKDIVINNIESFGFNLESDNIQLIRGLFQETLNVKDVVAFAHIDCDWYDSVKICIDRITPRMSLNSVIVFDDYSSYSGCKKAVDELIDLGNFEILFCQRSIVLTKVR